MSEFQYLEFYSADKALTNNQIKEISSWSNRSEVSKRRAVFTYSYADFPKDEEKVLVKYFDSFFYIANWGTTRLMFKIPKESSNYKEIKSYGIKVIDSFENGMKVYSKSKHILIDIYFSEEEGYGWLDEEQSWLSELQELRNDIIKGDFRALFLIWLHGIHLKYTYEDIGLDFEIEKEKIPPNLKKLNDRLESLIELFGIDKDWIKAAAKYSEDVDDRPNYSLISKLPKSVKDEFLAKILNGEVNLATKLQLELNKIEAKKATKKTKGIVIRLEELLSSLR